VTVSMPLCSLLILIFSLVQQPFQGNEDDWMTNARTEWIVLASGSKVKECTGEFAHAF